MAAGHPTARKGHLKTLEEILGPRPNRRWEEEWVEMTVEYFQLRGEEHAPAWVRANNSIEQIKANYPEMFAKLKETSAAFIHDVDPRSFFEVTPEERLAKYEELWVQRGFSKWMGNFQDTLTDDAANEDYSEFVRNKIRERVHDPVVAEMLV